MNILEQHQKSVYLYIWPTITLQSFTWITAMSTRLASPSLFLLPTLQSTLHTVARATFQMCHVLLKATEERPTVLRIKLKLFYMAHSVMQYLLTALRYRVLLYSLPPLLPQSIKL